MWDLLSSSSREAEQNAQTQLLEMDSGTTSFNGTSSSGDGVSGPDFTRGRAIDDLLSHVGAQEAMIRDVLSLCDIAEELCIVEEDRFKQQLSDLPIWDPTPHELMAELGKFGRKTLYSLLARVQDLHSCALIEFEHGQWNSSCIMASDDTQKSYRSRHHMHKLFDQSHKSLSPSPSSDSHSKDSLPTPKAPPVDLSKLEIGALWRYLRHFNLMDGIRNPFSREQLVDVVQRPFMSQQMDEMQVIKGFAKSAKRVKRSTNEGEGKLMVPYAHVSPLQTAVGVVKEGLRPSIPRHTHPLVVELLERCWQQEASLRPEFSEITCVATYG